MSAIEAIRITERHGNAIIVAETLDGATWSVSTTRADGELLSCASLRGPRAAFEAGRLFQQDVDAWRSVAQRGGR